MRNKIFSFLRDHVSPGTRITVAVSGGKDSMALLHAALSLAPRLELSLSAAHFNHHLRGEEAQRDEDFVREFCVENTIPLAVGGAAVAEFAQKHSLGTEEAARRLRYHFFDTLDTDYILTAHTAQDNLETVLMHLLRGTGLHGLTGIPPVRGNILRPMLEVDRREVQEYLSRHGIPHVEDSSNREDDYLRNRLRHEVLPLLEQENPQCALGVTALCETLRREDAYLAAQAGAALAGLCPDGALSVPGLLSLPEALQWRVLGLFLQKVPELARVHLDAAQALCRSSAPSARYDLPGGWVLRRQYEVLLLEPVRIPKPVPEPLPIFPGQTMPFGPWQITCREGPARRGQLCLRREAVSLPLVLRTRQPGDTISLPGGTKKLSRLMIDEKIPAPWRDTFPIVWSDGKIAALTPGKIAAFCRPTLGQTSILLEMKRMEE